MFSAPVGKPAAKLKCMLSELLEEFDKIWHVLNKSWLKFKNHGLNHGLRLKTKKQHYKEVLYKTSGGIFD